MPGNELYQMVCPFFRRTEPGRIVCEGIYPRSCIRQEFEREDGRQEHLNRYCKSMSYPACEIYRAVLEANYAKEVEDE